MMQVPLSTKALLYLYDNRRDFKEGIASERITQEGIAKAIDMPRSHVTRIVRPLIDEGLIDEAKGRVRGRGRMLKVYTLTPVGFEWVGSFLREMGGEGIVVVRNGDEHSTTVAEVLEMEGRPCTLDIVNAVVDGVPIRLREGRILISNVHHEGEDFFEREEELDLARDFLEGPPVAMVIVSNRGYGSSAMMRKVAVEMTDRPLLWHDLEVDGSGRAIYWALERMMGTLQCDSLDELKGRRALICFDNFHIPPECGVDCIIELFERLYGGQVKIMVAMRGDTPSYNRFYQKEDVDRGRVVELRMKRLSQDCLTEMFGPDMDDEAMKLIYMLTKGQPLALCLLREGDEAGLRALFPNEEVRFMMYLREKKRS